MLCTSSVQETERFLITDLRVDFKACPSDHHRLSNPNRTIRYSHTLSRDINMSSHSTRSSTAFLARNRQYTHLQSQLAQLNAHLADTENLLAMTAVQAEYLRGLGGWWGGLYVLMPPLLENQKSCWN